MSDTIHTESSGPEAIGEIARRIIALEAEIRQLTAEYNRLAAYWLAQGGNDE